MPNTDRARSVKIWSDLHGDVERPFSIHEACDVGIQSFLLIVRTWRIVTVHAFTLRRGCDKDS